MKLSKLKIQPKSTIDQYLA